MSKNSSSRAAKFQKNAIMEFLPMKNDRISFPFILTDVYISEQKSDYIRFISRNGGFIE